MRVAGSRQLKLQISDLRQRARAGDVHSEKMLQAVAAELELVRLLKHKPNEDLPLLMRVRQSRRYEVWRVSHPYIEDLAVRTIIWFVDPETAVLALFVSDKARMGDVFYDTVGARADQIIEEWCRSTRAEEQ